MVQFKDYEGDGEDDRCHTGRETEEEHEHEKLLGGVFRNGDELSGERIGYIRRKEAAREFGAWWVRSGDCRPYRS
jgi:hypothetical protein